MTRVARVLRNVLVAAVAVMTVACQSTVGGKAVLDPDEVQPDGAVIARMNTGTYPTTPGRIFQTADDDLVKQATLEGHRLGAIAVGPWQINASLVDQPSPENLWTGQISGLVSLRDSQLLSDAKVDAAAAHGFFCGFYTIRVSQAGGAHTLQSMMLEFDDEAGAAAMATEMAGMTVSAPGEPFEVPVTLPYQPDASAFSFAAAGGTTVRASVAQGRFVVLAGAHTPTTDSLSASLLTDQMLGQQRKALKRFVPTDPAMRAALPMDPTGVLMSKALWAADGKAPFIVGVWEPSGWLHFEDDPVKSAAVFKDAGVDVVAQRLTTIYQTPSAYGATKVVDRLVADMAATTDVQPAAGVPGLPSAKCFVRDRGYVLADSPTSWQRVYWRYKCVAQADRYAFTAFSVDDADVHQQMSAQYRLLAGK